MATDENGVDRRGALQCMLWAGTGVLWTVAGGVPKSSLLGSAQAAEGGFSFLQISDSHVGFDKPANPNALGTLQEAIGKVVALPAKPAFMIHTGDISPSVEAASNSTTPTRRSARPSSTSITCRANMTSSTRGRARPISIATAANAKGAGWYSFDQGGVHFIGLVNVVDLKAGGMGNLGADQTRLARR